MILKIMRANVLNNAKQEFYTNLQNSRKQGVKNIIFTPDRMAFSTEQELFTFLNEKSIFDISVVTISRFSKKYLANKNINQKILTKIGCFAILRKILDDNKQDLTVFRKAIYQNTFPAVLMNAISLLKSCNITPEQINIDGNDQLAQKLNAIKLVYQQYEAFIQNNYMDSFNRLKLFIDLLNSGDFQNTNIYFYGFDSFTPEQYNLIQKFIKVANSVTITVCDGAASNRRTFVNQTYQNLISLASVVGVHPQIFECTNKLIGTQNVLSQYLFTSKYPHGLTAQDIWPIKFDNINDEITYVAKQIKFSMVFEGKKYKDYTVVVNNLSSYKNKIKQIFGERGINFFVDENDLVSDNIVYKYILSILQYVFLNRSTLMQILKNPLSGLDILETQKLELQLGEFPFRDINKFENVHIDILNFVNMLNTYKKQKRTTFADYYNTYLQIIENIKLADNIQRLQESYKQNKDFVTSSLMGQCQDTMDTALAEVADVLQKFNIMPETFVKIIETIGNNTISLPPILADSVFVCDMNNSYFNPNTVLFVLNAGDNMPLSLDDNGLISDYDIYKLKHKFVLTPTVKQINAQYKFNVYQNLLKYQQQLVLCYNTSNKKLPSTIVNDICAMFNLKTFDGSAIQNIDNVNYNEDIVKFLTFNGIFDKDLDATLLTLLKKQQIDVNNPLLQYSHNIKSYIPNLTYENHPHITCADKLFFTREHTSVSEFESFSRCPYRHFVDYGLKLQPNLVSSLNNMDYGTIIHEFIKGFVSKISHIRQQQDIISVAQKVINDVLSSPQNVKFTEDPTNRFNIASLKEETKRLALRVYKQIYNSNFKPYALEKPFVIQDVLNINGRKIGIKGIIDRVDVCDDHFVVIDYKTGKADFANFGEFMSGKKLQLFVYIYAYENMSHKQPFGAFYMPITNKYYSSLDQTDKLKGVIEDSTNMLVNLDTAYKSNNSSEYFSFKLDRGAIKSSQLVVPGGILHKLGEQSIHKIEQSGQQIVSGNIEPYPFDNTCEFCDYKGMCMFNMRYGNNIRKSSGAATYQDVLEVEK